MTFEKGLRTPGKPEPLAIRGRGRKLAAWLRANALPLISLGFIAGTTTAAFIFANEDGPSILYKQGIIGNERMTLDEKMIAWKYRLTSNGRCPARADYDRVIGEMQDEMFRYMRLGDKEAGQKVWRAMEAFSAIRITAKENGECQKDGPK